jgi:hypothetical protein
MTLSFLSGRRGLSTPTAFWLLLLLASTWAMGQPATGTAPPPSAPAPARVRLAPGNGIWLKPATTKLPGHEADVVAACAAHSIKHVFLWTVGYTEARYAVFEPFIRQAHTHGLTVHALCVMKRTVTSEKKLSPALLDKALCQITAYNATHPDAAFDGAQIDIEDVSGPDLLQLLKQVHVPATLVLSAAIQPNEFYPDMESSWAAMIRETDLSLLVPMLYTMDDLFYKGGTVRTGFDIARLQARTAGMLSRLPSNGSLMIGLSGYDREYPVIKSTGAIDKDYLSRFHSADGFSEPALSPDSSYGMPGLLSAGKPLLSVCYQTNTGLSVYRFDYDTNRWLDVIETTPLCLRRSIAAANQGGAGHPCYVGACVWLYQTVFDSHSGRPDGLLPDNGASPKPQATVEVLGFKGGVARLRVTLTNANPAQPILGAPGSSGVYLRLEGASFLAADKGGFHEVEAVDGSGRLSTSVNGSQIIELRRSFFENPDSQQAQSGEITIAASSPFTIHYRSWMTSKESICRDGRAGQPWVARSPDDIHYEDSSRLVSYTTLSTIVAPD